MSIVKRQDGQMKIFAVLEVKSEVDLAQAQTTIFVVDEISP